MRAQVLTLQPDLHGIALRALVRDLINTTDGTNFFIDQQWGLSGRYILGDDNAHAHPLVGCSAPDFEFEDESRLGAKLVGGQGLLIDFGNNAVLKELVLGGKHNAWVEYVGIGAKDTRGLSALLVRPDGVVAWAAEEQRPDVDTAKAALEQWFKF